MPCPILEIRWLQRYWSLSNIQLINVDLIVILDIIFDPVSPVYRDLISSSREYLPIYAALTLQKHHNVMRLFAASAAFIRACFNAMTLEYLLKVLSHVDI